MLSAAALAYAGLAGSQKSPNKTHHRHALTVKGHVEDLQPGVTTTLDAQVRNNLLNQVRLRGIRTTVGDASPECPATMLTAPRVRVNATLRPRRVRTVLIPITLAGTAPDACQSATFPLEFAASARRRDGSF